MFSCTNKQCIEASSVSQQTIDVLKEKLSVLQSKLDFYEKRVELNEREGLELEKSMVCDNV